VQLKDALKLWHGSYLLSQGCIPTGAVQELWGGVGGVVSQTLYAAVRWCLKWFRSIENTALLWRLTRLVFTGSQSN